MEMHLVKRDEKKKIKNVEIYKQDAFNTLIRKTVTEEAKKLSLIERLFGKFPTLGEKVYTSLNQKFKERLKKNINH